MADALVSRVKFGFMLVLFLLPVVVAAWSQHLTETLKQTMRFDPLPLPAGFTTADQ